ncbi:MAG TPA: NfeD family protein [Candidatus Limnocylindrales bacterium]|nr:NfeD family protein [Candidatus Limnocylindrales bacterium]
MGLFWFWLVVAGVLVITEVLTLAFFAAFLALGALGAALASLLGLPPLLDAVVFGVVGVGGIVVARPTLLRLLGRRPEPLLRSGADSMIGQQAVLQDPILGPDHPGHVKIAGELWPALSATGAAIPADTPVVVRALRSTTLIVDVEGPRSIQAPSA